MIGGVRRRVAGLVLLACLSTAEGRRLTARRLLGALALRVAIGAVLTAFLPPLRAVFGAVLVVALGWLGAAVGVRLASKRGSSGP